MTKTSSRARDVFTGTADALVAAGLITPGELKPQKGRPDGCTAFLAGGEPCPPSRRAWREPGYRAIRLLDDGTYRLEVTVSKEVQAWRRKQAAAAEHEAEQDRINKEVAEEGHKYRNWALRHDFGGYAETWEGTKAQLQAHGIGVGLKFPGEPGAPEELQCKCPLGFAVRVFRSSCDRAKTAAGIYIAQSFYLPRCKEPKQYVAHAPGVMREVSTAAGWLSSDLYYGTANALIAAGLVPDFDLFPGQPGRNKVQASYRKDWTPATTSNGQEWGATICKRGKGGQYSVEVPVSQEEEQRRRSLRKSRDDENQQKERAIADERRKLRQLANGTEMSVEKFRENCAWATEVWIGELRRVFAKADGVLRFDIPEDSELSDELAEAFQTIREAVQTADVTHDKKLEAEVHKRLKLTAAQNDKGLQSLLHSTKHLRLVHSAPDGQ
ncbi:hypothetical protein [Caenimonas soli]|uniref:hypothetical protein n=1 Tax=Caenimonas soli TaxID=2735555 RepID=UPI0015548134|nr:hypothetical protein [Caenimonas soli]NPC57857.1 hypothetical protein [Caenimonas soli]